MSLREYTHKRHFNATPEPAGRPSGVSARGGRRPAAARLRYVVQKHRARSLHYDFRLEWNGALLSWAVPKGPSLDPSTKRLAMRVEDHPIEYAGFEGRIPEGQYGAGVVAIWDEGKWRPEDSNVDAALRRGELRFSLEGKKLTGAWVLVRTRLGVAGNSKRQAWLLIRRAAHSDAGSRRRPANTLRRGASRDDPRRKGAAPSPAR